MQHTILQRRVPAAVTVLALMLSLFAWTAATAPAAYAAVPSTAAPYTGQTAQGDYTIETAAQLAALAATVNATSPPQNTYADVYVGSTFYLIAGIDLSQSDSYGGLSWTGNTNWTPISTPTIGSASTGSPIVNGGTGFGGTFDGNGFAISNLSLTASTSGVGLFGFLTPSGTIQNLTVSGTATVTGGVDAVGGVVGYNSGAIEKVTNGVNVNAANAYNVGGIAGFNNAYYDYESEASVIESVGAIYNSQNAGTITGYTKVGGIAGENAGAISSCSNIGAITAMPSGKSGVGGIVGRNGNNNSALEAGAIIDCYNAGTVSASNGSWCGGIVGFNNKLSTYRNNYNVGALTAYGFRNAIAGLNESTVITQSDNFSLNNNTNTGSVSETGTVYTAASGYMYTQDFVDLLNNNTPNNPTVIWKYVSGGYPDLNYVAPQPVAPPAVPTNNYSIVYLGGTGSSDDNAGNDPAAPLATLERAVAVAGASTVSTVSITVQAAITVSDTQTALGGAIPVNWTTGVTGPMFTVASGGNLTVGGLLIDGNGVNTVFSVASGGSLTLRNNASVSDCAVGVDVANGGSLNENQSSITGTANSVKLAGGASYFRMFAGPNQSIALNGTVYLGSGAYISVESALTGNITVQMANPAVNQIVAQRVGTYAFTANDLAQFAYDGGGHTFKLYPAFGTTKTQIQIAS